MKNPVQLELFPTPEPKPLVDRFQCAIQPHLEQVASCLAQRDLDAARRNMSRAITELWTTYAQAYVDPIHNNNPLI